MTRVGQGDRFSIGPARLFSNHLSEPRTLANDNSMFKGMRQQRELLCTGVKSPRKGMGFHNPSYLCRTAGSAEVNLQVFPLHQLCFVGCLHPSFHITAGGIIILTSHRVIPVHSSHFQGKFFLFSSYVFPLVRPLISAPTCARPHQFAGKNFLLEHRAP